MISQELLHPYWVYTKWFSTLVCRGWIWADFFNVPNVFVKGPINSGIKKRIPLDKFTVPKNQSIGFT
jgi:hypothetical protein